MTLEPPLTSQDGIGVEVSGRAEGIADRPKLTERRVSSVPYFAAVQRSLLDKQIEPVAHELCLERPKVETEVIGDERARELVNEPFDEAEQGAAELLTVFVGMIRAARSIR